MSLPASAAEIGLLEAVYRDNFYYSISNSLAYFSMSAWQSSTLVVRQTSVGATTIQNLLQFGTAFQLLAVSSGKMISILSLDLRSKLLERTSHST